MYGKREPLESLGDVVSKQIGWWQLKQLLPGLENQPVNLWLSLNGEQMVSKLSCELFVFPKAKLRCKWKAAPWEDGRRDRATTNRIKALPLSLLSISPH